MLVEFSVANHLSFKDKKTLSLEAAPIKEHEENIIESAGYKLLRSAVIYGANSSGKSNFIKSLTTMQTIVSESAKKTSTDKIEVEPFLLNTETENEPSFFEILFLLEGQRYRYGFEANQTTVISEWLFVQKGKKETYLFLRQRNEFEFSDAFAEGKGLELRTRDNALFLSTVDQWNGPLSKKIMLWFNSNTILSGLKHEKDRLYTLACYDMSYWRKELEIFLNQFNLGFTEFYIDEEQSSQRKNAIFTYHNKFNNSGVAESKIKFNLTNQESSGTNKLFDMAGNIIVGLITGRLTIIDELDAKLHPLITLSIVKLFNSPFHNRNNAQLIFATHDTNLLSKGCFRRDQIYFTEKDKYEATDLYSLVEYEESDGTKVRNDRRYEKDYINGRYGAIPFIGDFFGINADE
ncbi:MAG TPA: ATP-binding protein [Mucilaginibacter sp.]|nr:ATP-binding protein [Mucilaginibacter sp.]